MKPTHLALLAALSIGVGIGVTALSADAQQMRSLQVVGGPLVPVGASGNVAWVLDPNSRTIYACTSASTVSCAKTPLP